MIPSGGFSQKGSGIYVFFYKKTKKKEKRKNRNIDFNEALSITEKNITKTRNKNVYLFV